MKNILVVNVNWIGDVIFSLPAFKALKTRFPQARVVCMCVPRVQPLLQSCPDIDSFITFDEKGTGRGLLAKLKLMQSIRREKFDAAFILRPSRTRELLLKLAGVPVRVGYKGRGKRSFVTQAIKDWDEDSHRSDHYLRVMEEYGIPVEDRQARLIVNDHTRSETDEMLKKHGVPAGQKFIVVNTGGNWDLKRWPRDSFSALIGELAQVSKVPVVIPGAEKDLELAEEVARDSGVSPVVLAGKTTLATALGLLERAQLLISADSGPIHMAGAVGTKVIALFGPTRPEITGPRGFGEVRVLQNDVGCNRSPCYYLNCPDNICMKSIKVSDVVRAAVKCLEEDCESRAA